MRGQLQDTQQKRSGQKHRLQTRHGVESKTQFKTEYGVQSKSPKRPQNKVQHRLNNPRAGPQSSQARSHTLEQKTLTRGKLGYRSPSANALSQTKGTAKVRCDVESWLCQAVSESNFISPLFPRMRLCQAPRTESPRAGSPPEQKTSARGKVSYRSPSGSPLSRAKGTSKV